MPRGGQPLAVFISYSHRDKQHAGAVKSVLSSELGADCFLAHEDLRVSDEWKRCIERELRRCEVFVALLSEYFKASNWAPQELGFALARRVLIIPISLDGTLPFGFSEHLQAERMPPTIGMAFFIPALARKFPRRIFPRLIEDLRGATSYRGAEQAMKPLMPLLERFDEDEIEALARACIDNSEVWDATDCRLKYIPALIENHGERMKPETLKILSALVEHEVLR